MSTPTRIVVLSSGAATMALQMACVRLLAPAVGSSSVVWATIIGLALVAMSLGYVIGGRIADRAPRARVLRRTLGAAALLVMLLVPGAGPVTSLVVRIESDALASAIGFLATGVPALVLLGITPPFVIRLLVTSVGGSGSVAGRVYALSTVGSIMGTLLTALVLVQWIGTRATLLGIALILVGGAMAAGRIRPVDVHDGAASGTRQARSAPASIALPAASLLVLLEGVAMMATEMSIARLVAPFFGTSHAVWAVIIATVMGSIALGSRLGGRLADRHPTRTALAAVLALACVSVALLPLVAAPVMRPATGGIQAAALGTVVAAFCLTMVLLVVPVTLLGMVPPWVLRLTLASTGRAGRTAGLLYATSTAGALLGTWGSVLWLVPAIGTRRTLAAVALLLAAGSLACVLGRGAGGRRGPARAVVTGASLAAALAAMVVVVPVDVIKPVPGGVVRDEHESRYQFVQVVDDVDSPRRYLQLNEGWAVHSIWDPDSVLVDGIWDHFLLMPALLPAPQERVRMLVVGSAAGTAGRAYATVHPDVELTSVELDPVVTDVGRRWFGLRGRVVEADGRPFLARAGGREWELIHVDAYRQPYIPFHLTTREFFELARTRLADGGVFSINVGSTPQDQRINEAVAATMREVFPYVVRYRAERYNELIIGIDDPRLTTQAALQRIRSSALSRGTVGGTEAERARLQRLTDDLARGMRAVDRDPDRVLTDDRAPVEWMTDRMIFGAAG